MSTPPMNASLSARELRDFYRNKHALVTGGLGHIGSNLAIALVALGARVTVVDNSIAGCGANEFNLAPIAGNYTLWNTDIAQVGDYPCVLESADVVFNLAGEVSHVHSMLFPERDLAINAHSQMMFLQGLARYAPGRRVVYASTRQVYGRPEYLPVDESHPVEPPDFNGVHKHAACAYHRLLGKLGQIDPIVLRLTNVIGPRMAIGLPCQGFLSDFTRRALCGESLVLFGDGQQVRDPIFVEDAVDAFLRAGAVTVPRRRTFNVGAAEPLALTEIAQSFARLAGLAPAQLREFPSHRSLIDIGGYRTDPAACHEVLGWKATTSLPHAVEQTLAYYAGKTEHYLPNGSTASCPLNHLVS